MNEINKKSVISESAPSIIKDPFNKDGFDGLSIYVSRKWFSDEWDATGTINFKNGNTNGEQKFKNQTLDGLLIEMKQFLDSLS